MPITIENYPWSDWEPIEQIGSGGFGTVYKAKQHLPFLGDKFSAIKVRNIHNDKNEAEDFSNEISLMEELRDNPNVVRIEAYTIKEHSDGESFDFFIRMELLNSFEDRIKGKSLSPEETVRLGTVMCDVLTELEKKKIVHRDIKPAHILVDDDGNYKLGGFGIARVIDSDTIHTAVGTPIYAAPEVWGGHYDHRVDIYSLGLTLWVCLNRGIVPFVDMGAEPTPEEHQHSYIMRISGKPLPDAVDSTPELMTVIRKACAYNPNDRYSTAAEFKAALEWALNPVSPATATGLKSHFITVFQQPMPTIPDNRNDWVIPAGCTYKTIDGNIFNGGDVISKSYEPKIGDTLKTADYRYCLGEYRNYDESLKDGEPYWYVWVKDKGKTSYEPLLGTVLGIQVQLRYTFYGCTSLTAAPVIPESVTDMSFCFYLCTSLTAAPVIPESVTNMSWCFWDCTSMTAAPVIPESVTDMMCCFHDCTSLTAAPVIPKGVTDMYACFDGCTALKGNIDFCGCPEWYDHCLYRCGRNSAYAITLRYVGTGSRIEARKKLKKIARTGRWYVTVAR